MLNILSRYLNRKQEDRNENLEELEKLTQRIIAKSSAPEYPIMQVLIELSEHGVLGLNKNGDVIFNNVAALSLLKKEDLKGNNILNILKGPSSENIRNFIFGQEDHEVTKVDIDSSESGQVFDVVAYKVKNGEIHFIVFLINCLEHLMFRKEHCPLRQNCPFNYKCKKQEAAIEQ